MHEPGFVHDGRGAQALGQLGVQAGDLLRVCGKVADLMTVDYSALEGRKASMLNLVPGDWESARSLFS